MTGRLKELLVTLLLVEAASESPGEWKVARGSFFDAPQYWKEWYPPGQFGDLFINSCGYTDHEEGVRASNDMFSFPTDAVGSLADVLPDYVGGHLTVVFLLGEKVHLYNSLRKLTDECGFDGWHLSAKSVCIRSLAGCSIILCQYMPRWLRKVL